MQHPPFGLPGQLVKPLAVSQVEMVPAQLAPSAQQPTLPKVVLEMMTHRSLLGQHKFGSPTEAQLFVFDGQEN